MRSEYLSAEAPGDDVASRFSPDMPSSTAKLWHCSRKISYQGKRSENLLGGDSRKGNSSYVSIICGSQEFFVPL